MRLSPVSRFVLVVLLGLSACASTPDAPTPRAPSGQEERAEETTMPSSALPDVSRDRALAHVRKLAKDIGVRVRTRPGERLGADYIAEQFTSLGYEVNIQEFSVDDRRSRNVVAWWPDARRYPIVLGAHMDTVPRSPGANDNASGVAALLEVARIVGGQPQATYLRFVAFGAEEYGTDRRHHVGSEVFVRRLGKEGRRRLGGMVSVDMVADGRPLVVGTSGIGPEVVARTLYRKIDDAGIAVRYRTLCDCSDNGPFEHAGIPASFMWSGPEANYHDPSDTVRNLDPDDLLRSARAVRTFVRHVDQAMLDRFRKH